MNCEHAIELLPWMLNGTLDAGEHSEVRRHLETCESCRQALRDTRQAWTVFAQHLPAAALVALAYGEAPAGLDSALAERHLASCPQCAADLELARMSRRLEEDDRIAVFPAKPARTVERPYRSWRAAALAAGLAGVVAAAGWLQTARQAESLAERLAQRPAPAAEVRPAPPVPSATGDEASRQRIAELEARVRESEQTQAKMSNQFDQAASQIADLQRQADARLEPQINPWSDLVSAGDVVRGEPEEASEVVIPANRAAVPFLEASGPSDVREIEILNAAGEVLWKASGLRATKAGDYRVSFPADFLKPGRYKIQLYSREGGQRVPREIYKIRVE